MHELFDGIEIDTLRSRRTEGRGHIYFQYNDKIKSQKPHELGFEILSNGNNAVMPPSIHASGDVYHWIDESIPVNPMPEELINRINGLVEKKKKIIE